MKIRSECDLWNGSRQAVRALSAKGYGHEDIVVRLSALRLPCDRAWVKWWVLHSGNEEIKP